MKDDLQPAFRFALENSERSTLEAIQQVLNHEYGWGLAALPEEGTRENAWISAVVGNLDSEERWAQVVEWVGLFHGRVQGRSRIGLWKLAEKNEKQVEKYGLKRGEMLAAYLYTGPCYLPFNSVYRNYPPSMVELLKGESGQSKTTLSTVLFCISSALVKLGRHTELPENGKVYRGLGKMLLPSQFWVEHQDLESDCPPWKGGVERAFMSTTSDMNVALHYSMGTGTVVELSVGRIQIGGELGWVSMVSSLVSQNPVFWKCDTIKLFLSIRLIARPAVSR